MSVRGKVVAAYGNMITASFETDVQQNEVAYVITGDRKLKSEVIRVRSTVCDMQVFEDTGDIRLPEDPVERVIFQDRAKAAIKALEGNKRCRVTSPAGTDLLVSIEGRPALEKGPCLQLVPFPLKPASQSAQYLRLLCPVRFPCSSKSRHMFLRVELACRRIPERRRALLPCFPARVT